MTGLYRSAWLCPAVCACFLVLGLHTQLPGDARREAEFVECSKPYFRELLETPVWVTKMEGGVLWKRGVPMVEVELWAGITAANW